MRGRKLPRTIPWLCGVATVVFLVGCVTRDLFRGIEPVPAKDRIAVVIENPAGSHEKWEVRPSGRLIQEMDDEGPITIPFLPWPANGGMIPRTLLSLDLGGDGEPLDVLVLGEALPRGSIVNVEVIGVLHVVDRLERDDKILAVLPGSPLGDVSDCGELEQRFPGVLDILTIWFDRSRPGGSIAVQGYGSRGLALGLIAEGLDAFDRAIAEGRAPEWGRP